MISFKCDYDNRQYIEAPDINNKIYIVSHKYIKEPSKKEKEIKNVMKILMRKNNE